jgi:hypothetical protein
MEEKISGLIKLLELCKKKMQNYLKIVKITLKIRCI